MPKRSERGKKTKFRRRPGRKAKRVFIRGKTGKHHCGLCDALLHGVPHGKKPSKVGKMSKSEKRPSAVFAGVLCTRCRTLVVEEAAKVLASIKGIDDVELRLRKYVEEMRVR